MPDVRKSPCDTCPFRRVMTAAELDEVREPGNGPNPGVLCHTDGFENDGAFKDCAGYYENLFNLGRRK